MAPFRVTGGRAPGGCRLALDQDRSCCQEGPAEEGGASHPRSTVTHCHVGLKPSTWLETVSKAESWLRSRDRLGWKVETA